MASSSAVKYPGRIKIRSVASALKTARKDPFHEARAVFFGTVIVRSHIPMLCLPDGEHSRRGASEQYVWIEHDPSDAAPNNIIVQVPDTHEPTQSVKMPSAASLDTTVCFAWDLACARCGEHLRIGERDICRPCVAQIAAGKPKGAALEKLEADRRAAAELENTIETAPITAADLAAFDANGAQ